MTTDRRAIGRHRKPAEPMERYWKAWLKLDAMSDEQLESAEADAIRDNADKYWYAMTPEQLSLFHKRVKEHNAKKKTGSLL